MQDLSNSVVPLVGDVVTLVPLLPEHADELVLASKDGNLSSLWFTSVPNTDTVDQYIDMALTQQGKGLALPYAVKLNSTGKIIGSTRICSIDKANRRCEVGYTWYAKSYQRTGVNTDCKLLILSHAFETLNAIAVEFKTHWHNMASRAAIARLGAKQDGVLRNHRIQPDGSYRDTVVFSIIENEWPTVRKALKHKQEYHR